MHTTHPRVFGLILADSNTQTQIRMHALRSKSWPVQTTVSFLKKNIYLTYPALALFLKYRHRTRLRCENDGQWGRWETRISVTAGETDLYLFPQLSYALALLAFHSFFLVWGRNTPADVLLHCDWLIQSCLGKLCPPRPLLFIFTLSSSWVFSPTHVSFGSFNLFSWKMK